MLIALAVLELCRLGWEILFFLSGRKRRNETECKTTQAFTHFHGSWGPMAMLTNKDSGDSTVSLLGEAAWLTAL